MKKTVLVVLLLMIAVACGEPVAAPVAAPVPVVAQTEAPETTPAPTEPATRTLTGVIVVTASDALAEVDGECVGYDGGYEDFVEGTQVTLTDESGAVIGVGELGGSNYKDIKDTWDYDEMTDDARCTFKFIVEDVPDANFYQLSLMGMEGPRYSKAELEQKGWRMELDVS